MNDKRKLKVNKSKMYALFGIAIFVFSIFGYAIISTSYMPRSNNEKYIHIHATLSIEGVNMSTLKTYSDFAVPPVLHIHFMTTISAIAILHMETYPPKPEIKVFFKSIGFNTSNYYIYANDKEVSYNYIFKNGDILNLMLKNTSINKASVNITVAKAFFNIFESGNVTKLKAFK